MTCLLFLDPLLKDASKSSRQDANLHEDRPVQIIEPMNHLGPFRGPGGPGGLGGSRGASLVFFCFSLFSFAIF